MVKAKAVADYFLTKNIPGTDYEITHLKLQKLVYYAEALYLAVRKDSPPLIDEDFEAWVHGPVCKELYNEYRGYGYRPLPVIREDEVTDSFSKDIKEILDAVWLLYGKYDGKALEDKTHNEEPWLDARGNDIYDYDRSNNKIDKSKMRSFYKKHFFGEEE